MIGGFLFISKWAKVILLNFHPKKIYRILEPNFIDSNCQ